jgi:hypothetical protein
MHYRIYFLSRTGNITRGSDAQHPDDQSACAAALLTLSGDDVVEIWCGTRRVGQVSHRILCAGRETLTDYPAPSIRTPVCV